ncbi:NAD-dependent epimerase/dehydratase family protein [Lichenifustis flavocetrariae]|uniref:NAD(P)-dependent oxidoreductase n=1 Tax=Lichenifustis flavocetrariae TaxID=2949735 RepID=A0AA41Z293_9HYPH|nr:NAD(P)-dependent oxidoreductase [Lichenifustis flavocetrariae]MCW6511666.1 NAD(P)-dependent oxidoreductase [Lichenifustis flavocetrariae]
MTLLITGATGFAMSVLARVWLEAKPDRRAVILDQAPLDSAATRYFAPVRDRLAVLNGDVTQPDGWRTALDRLDITHVVHGATVTPISRGSATEAAREPEAEMPFSIMNVNLMGTMHLLEWARSRPELQRFIYVSSGAVYRHHGPDTPGEPLPEDGYVAPRRLYGISKLASELVTERYRDLFGLSAASVRLSSVYGTMDRTTASRNFRHLPNRIAHLALDRGGAIRVNALDGVGDYLHAEDVAHGIIALLDAATLRHAVYNVALGETATIADMIGWAAERVAGVHGLVVPPDDADILQDSPSRGGMWGAYDISRIVAETGWRPRPMRDAFHAYMDWIAAERDGPSGEPRQIGPAEA